MLWLIQSPFLSVSRVQQFHKAEAVGDIASTDRMLKNKTIIYQVWLPMKHIKQLLPPMIKQGMYSQMNLVIMYNPLTQWGRVTHICVSKLTCVGSDNGLSPGRRQAIIWTNAGILLLGPLGTNFSENLIEIHIFSFKKMHLKMSSGKWRPFCLGLNVLRPGYENMSPTPPPQRHFCNPHTCYQHRLNCIRAWISIYIHGFHWVQLPIHARTSTAVWIDRHWS